MSTLVIDQPAEGVTLITLQRPERLNAMNATLVGELHEALDAIAPDRSCRVVVLTGAGRGFCAGVDLSGYGQAPSADGRGRVEDTFATQTHIAALGAAPPRHAATGDRRGQRSRRRRWIGPGPGQRHPHRRRLRPIQRRLRPAGHFGMRHRRELAAPPAHRRLPGLGAHAHRADHRRRRGRPHRARPARRPRRPTARGRAGHGCTHRGQQPLGHPDDQGSHVVPARGWLAPGRHRPREPDAGPLLHDRGHARSGGGLLGEAATALSATRWRLPSPDRAACPRARVGPRTNRAWLRWSNSWGPPTTALVAAGVRRWAVALRSPWSPALCAACSSGPQAPRDLADPSHSVVPVPDYTDVCAPLGADNSTTCLQVTLDAIDTARAQEGLGPMALPANFAQLSIPEQLFVALDAERVDRGLAPFAGLSAALNRPGPAGRRRGPAPRPARPRSTPR